MRLRSMTTPPAWGTTMPAKPVPAPRGITRKRSRLARATMACTCSPLVGQTAAWGRALCSEASVEKETMSMRASV